MTLRVVQWTTGKVGRQSVDAIVAHPDLELIGCVARSPDEVGRDVSELCGIGPVGVAATDDVEALLALTPDPPPDFKGTTMNDLMRLPMILTAMPAINAIPKVVAAVPGIVSYTDILPLPRGLVRL